MSTEMLLELERVSFAYPARASRRAFALSEVSLRLAAGEMVGVIGPNSSGKTTLIRLLTRMLEPATGEIRLEGVPVGRLARDACAIRRVPSVEARRKSRDPAEPPAIGGIGGRESLSTHIGVLLVRARRLAWIWAG